MMAHLRRLWARCFPRLTDADLRAHLRDARAFGVLQQREAHRSIRALRNGQTGNFFEDDLFPARPERRDRP